jgi:GT2 family glycosyltransferase
VQTHDHVGKNLSVVNTQVLSQRQQTEFIEFHCVLIRKSVFEKVGLLDEQYCAINDHEDLCLLASQAGESIWIEPAAVARYDYSRPQQWCDLPFFSLRWSENWTKISVEHFCSKWDIADDDPWRKLPVNWVRFHRGRTPLPIACGAFVSRVIKAAFALQAAWTAVKKKPLVARCVIPSSETATRKSRMVVASRS